MEHCIYLKAQWKDVGIKEIFSKVMISAALCCELSW